MSRFAQLIIFTTICLSTLTSSMPVDIYGARQATELEATRDLNNFGSHIGLLAYRQDSVSPDAANNAQANPEASNNADDFNDFDRQADDDGAADNDDEGHDEEADEDENEETGDTDDHDEIDARETDSEERPEHLEIHLLKSKAKAAPKKAVPKPSAPKKAAPKPAAAKKPPPDIDENSTQCSKPTAKSTAAKKPSVASKLMSLFIRDAPEFVGFHGTNSDTATLWQQKGVLVKPTKPSGFFDFLGIPDTGAGTSGADSEIGPGVYVADEIIAAQGFANNNANNNNLNKKPNDPSRVTPKICAIFATSSGFWRRGVQKAFIPENLVGDSSNAAVRTRKENARLDHIRKAVPGILSPQVVVKFALFDRVRKTGQMVIPADITDKFSAQCFDANPLLRLQLVHPSSRISRIMVTR